MAPKRIPMSEMAPRKALAMGGEPVSRKNGGTLPKAKMVRDMDRDGMKFGGKVKGKKC